jgi:hypothetical protein
LSRNGSLLGPMQFNKLELWFKHAH